MRSRATKTPTNLSLRTDLARRAKALGLNLSEILDAALEERIREVERQQWLDANRDAIREYNARVEKHGVFSEGRRRF